MRIHPPFARGGKWSRSGPFPFPPLRRGVGGVFANSSEMSIPPFQVWIWPCALGVGPIVKTDRQSRLSTNRCGFLGNPLPESSMVDSGLSETLSEKMEYLVDKRKRRSVTMKWGSHDRKELREPMMTESVQAMRKAKRRVADTRRIQRDVCRRRLRPPIPIPTRGESNGMSVGGGSVRRSPFRHEANPTGCL